MGVLNGSLSYSRYFVRGSLPPNFKEIFCERVSQYTVPTLEDGNEEEVYGWASVHNVLDTNLSDPESLFLDHYLILALRIDAWKISPTLLKAHILEASERYLQQTGGEVVSRKEKAIIKEQVKQDLKRQDLPSVAVFDLCWDLNSNIVRFWSHSERVKEKMVELFEKTFGTQLIAFSAYTMAEHADVDEQVLQTMTELTPELFAAPTTEKGHF